MTEASQRSRMPGDREMVFMMAMVMALNALAIDSMLPALPAIGEGLGVAVANDRQYVISTYLFGIGAGSLVYGPLSDRFGRKGVLVPALFAYVAFSIGCGLATSFPMLLALRFGHGLISAALGVIVVAVIRDLFSGDAMAKRLSMIFLVFMIVPAIAPTMGAGITLFASWRAIFIVLAVMGVVMILWLRRLPETLHPEDVRPLDLRTMMAGWATVTRHRRAAGYMIASGMMQGALYGYLNSSEQIIADIFHARSWFPLVFACVALGIATANFSNAAIVERFGARRVSQSATFAFMITSIIQIAVALSGAETLWMFTVLMMVNVGLIGFIGSNFGSIAMEDFGHMAGVASSYQSFAKTLLAATVGALIGQQYNGTTLPLAYAFLISGGVGLTLVFWAERGKLFTRPGTAPKTPY
ncbi:multidrug effflux MFS transporter [Sphingopyxis sp. BSN-002]|uniref:multidrug effflux MFS transporter n=1 Tax=Sphingopyxis sp. BSN-002 TaxID=2911495 RepID=UPI001EDC0EF5|nr:multidrug effflux MFS transporter [Sphingopyxis sp. BSN-002]UKK83276.1 multidrug effflux MFS transporter [Sphingopyxis sp. BSN-002]